MRLSEAILVHEAKPLEIPFANGGILNITYKPAKFTVRELEEMTKKREIRAVITQLLRVVESWDLKVDDDDEKPIPLEVESLLDIDVQVFTHIITKVSEDQRASGEAAGS